MERYVREDAWARSQADPVAHLLLFDDGHELVAVAGHTKGTLVLADGDVVQAAHLVVAAVALDRQGGSIEGGKVADVVFSTLIADALWAHRCDVAFGLIDNANNRSLAVCRRNGLTSWTAVNATLTRVTGKFQAGSS